MYALMQALTKFLGLPFFFFSLSLFCQPFSFSLHFEKWSVFFLMSGLRRSLMSDLRKGLRLFFLFVFFLVGRPRPRVGIGFSGRDYYYPCFSFLSIKLCQPQGRLDVFFLFFGWSTTRTTSRCCVFRQGDFLSFLSNSGRLWKKNDLRLLVRCPCDLRIFFVLYM